jgi:PleD family two-component response regulator
MYFSIFGTVYHKDEQKAVISIENSIKTIRQHIKELQLQGRLRTSLLPKTLEDEQKQRAADILMKEINKIAKHRLHLQFKGEINIPPDDHVRVLHYGNVINFTQIEQISITDHKAFMDVFYIYKPHIAKLYVTLFVELCYLKGLAFFRLGYPGEPFIAIRHTSYPYQNPSPPTQDPQF